MIIETILSSVDENNLPNFAPMGVRFRAGDLVDIRPFSGSKTYSNLIKTGKGTINIVDDVLLIVETALYSVVPPYFTAKKTNLPVLQNACSYYGFEVVECDSSREPSRIIARILERGINKQFKGFCRASFAVLESAILATRLHLSGKKTVLNKIEYWAGLVEKTGGERELKAYKLVIDYVKTYEAI